MTATQTQHNLRYKIGFLCKMFSHGSQPFRGFRKLPIKVTSSFKLKMTVKMLIKVHSRCSCPRCSDWESLVWIYNYLHMKSYQKNNQNMRPLKILATQSTFYVEFSNPAFPQVVVKSNPYKNPIYRCMLTL